MSTSIASSTYIDLNVPRKKALQPKRAKDVPVSLHAIGLLVAWVMCAAVSLLALVPAHHRVMASASAPVAIKPVTLEVKLTDRSVNDSIQPSTPPPPASADPMPDVPLAPAVAEPSSAIAFAVPVEGPVRVVALANAGHSASPNRGTVSGVRGPQPQTLVFGQGEGVQPAPAYPPRAAKLFQEGVVVVRMTVDANGQVISAAAEQPCAWPLLNEAAVRTVEQKWRFSPGTVRVFDVSIHFRLKK